MGNYSSKELSEGEKKLLLIKFITRILSDENSIFLLDEPDSHIHINNKQHIKDHLYNPDHTVYVESIITTHSPTLSACFNDENLFMIDNGKLVERKKQEIIECLTGEFWNKQQQNAFISSTKPIIIFVEGKHDKTHITNAFRKLKDNYPKLDFDIYNMDGADNIPHIISGLRTSEIKHNTLFIGLFDNDSEGNDCCNKTQVKCYDKNNNPIEKTIKKGYVAFCYPTPSDYKSKELTVENLFDSTKYAQAYKEITKDYSFDNKYIDDISKDIKEKAKSKLAQMSSSFLVDDFKYFQPLFEKLKELWDIFTQQNENIETIEVKLQEKEIDTNCFFINKKGVKASAIFNSSNNNIELQNGSQIVLTTTSSCLPSTIKQRKQAIKDGSMQENGDFFFLTKNITFKKPSPASSFVLGSNNNGWTEWKNENGETIDDCFPRNKTTK